MNLIITEMDRAVLVDALQCRAHILRHVNRRQAARSLQLCRLVMQASDAPSPSAIEVPPQAVWGTWTVEDILNREG